MKKNISRIAIIVTVVMVGLYACTRDYALKSPTTSTAGGAYLRIVNAAPNFRNIYNKPDSFNVYVNGNKITGFTPGGGYLMTYGTIFPTASSLVGYVSVPAGLQQIKLTLGGVVTGDSIPITNFTKIFQADTYYSFVITDSILSNRDSSQIFVQDVFTAPPSGYYNLRFMHAVWNDTAGKNIDVFSTRNNRNIFINVKPGTITSFGAYPYNPSLTDTFFVRRAGNPGIALDTLINTSLFTNQRSYTLYYRGDGNTNYNTNPKRRHMATYIHN